MTAPDPPFGAHDGIYRTVSLFALPAWLDQGWTIEFLTAPYSACVRAPIEFEPRKRKQS